MDRSLLQAASGSHPDAIRSLVREGADVNVEGLGLLSPPIYAAVHMQRPDNLKALIEAGADVDRPNCVGQTALMTAVQSGNRDCVEILLGAGCDVTATDRTGQTAIDYAKEAPELKALLMQAGLEAH